jgi:hypothetical protein
MFSTVRSVLPFRLRACLLAVALVSFCLSCGERHASHSVSMSHPTIQDLAWGKVTVKIPDGALEECGDCVITPNSCMPWNFKKFGCELMQADESEISHIHPGKPPEERGTGVLPYAIKKLLHGVSDTDVVVIVSKGMIDALGVSLSAENYLKELKEGGKIEELLPAEF